MPLIKQYRSFSQSKPWTARFFLAVLIILILLALIRASLPLAIKLGATSWLESQGVETSIGDIEISLLDGSFAINDVAGKNKNGKGFSLVRFGFSWQWKPLFDNLAIVNHMEIKSLKVDATFFDNGDMNIAGLVIKAASEVPQPEPPTQSSEKAPATTWDATVKNITFSDVELCIQQYANTDKLIIDYCGKLADFEWIGDVSFKPSIQAETTTPPLYAQGTLSMHDIALQNNQLKLALMNVESIDVKTIDIDTPMNISIDNIRITKFSALQRANKTSPQDAQAFAFDRLNIHPLKLSQLNNLTLGTIDLIDTSIHLLANKDGRMEYERWLPEKQQAVPTGQKDTPEPTSAPFHFAFDRFNIITKHYIVFIDDSRKEPLTANIHNIDLSLTQLNSKNPDDLSHITLTLAIDKHGSFKLDVDANPLSDRPTVKGTGEISGFDLKILAPLTKQYIGHNIKSGQLDTDLKLSINKGIMDINMGLALHQFELKTLNKEEAEKLNSEFGFPLNSSLSLLRDKDNTIRLDLPVTGDIDSPEFDPRDALVTASSKAITAAVIHYYTPFGLVFAAGSLLDLATALSFEPVLFDAGTSELNSSHKQQLDKLVALMDERPGIHLTLCGISNNADKDKLLPEQKSTTATKNLPISKEALATLNQLAIARSANVKDYLVKEKSVKASRLIECSPEFINNEISGVEISI